MYSAQDIIVARATPPGQGGVGIIRISGKSLSPLVKELLGFLPKPRFATYCNFKCRLGTTIDQGLALYFQEPNSFTGEDVLELHGHGGAVVMDMLLQRILDLGARMAKPGEFSERAFLNNKIDLTQAEAIADLIEASSEQAARCAIQSLQGKFSTEINTLVNEVIQLRMYVEAAIDFPEEEIDFISDGKILASLQALELKVNDILGRANQGKALKEGIKVVIAGYPNAGKSSLLNALSGEDTAIVSDIPGTTRDIVKENILIDGMPLFLLDTAGLRLSEDTIEEEGVRRAWKEIPSADRILVVIEAPLCSLGEVCNHPLIAQFENEKERVTIIRNKIDLTHEQESMEIIDNYTVVNLSVKKHLGINALRQHLKECMGFNNNENIFIARRRHLDALNLAKNSIQMAMSQLITSRAGELVAEELREAQQALGEITGEFRSDDLLGKIFSSFCIGK